ncbi:hypothetical protein SAMN02745126_02495 [Enhydrobacter aerosaccus]|uniref:Lipoprotein n=1 Tax=Enhydrobacter aerosaccus TaxID=225324 RepID=A0A1T4NWL3_9HYPH|nr:hypothetical protein [Enhydrobacter aerosaccus]SJZ83613.1 hypothetical protein SAMN02745126_02495 [Enhydrobacter aerosaccus]
MRFRFLPTTAIAAMALLGGCAGAGDIAGTDYAPEYDYSEFYAVTNNKTFRVIVSGNPFPDMSQQEMERRLLPVMQANKPQPNLTFTYAVPVEEPRPDYRLVLVFNAATDLTAARVCANQIRHKPVPARPFDLFAVYCRNDLALSQSTAWTPATGPDDPRVGQLFSRLFIVLFDPFRRPRPHPFPFMVF